MSQSDAGAQPFYSLVIAELVLVAQSQVPHEACSLHWLVEQGSPEQSQWLLDEPTAHVPFSLELESAMGPALLLPETELGGEHSE